MTLHRFLPVRFAVAFHLRRVGHIRPLSSSFVFIHTTYNIMNSYNYQDKCMVFNMYTEQIENVYYMFFIIRVPVAGIESS